MSDIIERLRADVERVANPHLYETQRLMTAAADEIERLKAERDALLEALTDVGVFLDHCWRDVQMNDFSFEWLERMIAAIDAARGEK